MNRGEIWLAEVGRKPRPVLILTRSEVIDVRTLVTVAELTTQARGLSTEVPVDADTVGVARPSVVNCDGLHTIAQAALTKRLGEVNDNTMNHVCRAVSVALGCKLR